MRALLHPEYSFMGGDGKVITGGPEVGIGIAKMYAGAFPDGTLTMIGNYVVGDVSIAEIKCAGVHNGDLMGIAPTGKYAEVQVCNIVEMRAGLVYSEREYMDTGAMMAQLGIGANAS